MSSNRRVSSIAALSTLAWSSVALAQSVLKEADPPLVRWSEKVWDSARHGDEASLQQLLQALPADDEVGDYVVRFRESLQLHGSNQNQASSTQAESLEESMGELRENIEAHHLGLSLRSAIRVQDFGGDFNLVFDDPEVRGLIAQAKTRIPEVEEEGDWMEAQELLFLLRTLYEDTDRYQEYQDADKRLDGVNRRVSLLAQYAPRHLHTLRVKAAERNDEEPVPDFNPSLAGDWRERVEGIRASMLKGALKLAAREHIETEGAEGWRVLLSGGLEALKLLATTPGLDESFPELADENRVDRWVRFVDTQHDALETAEAGDLDSWRLSELIDRLIEVNEMTVRLPIRVLYREFGDGAVAKFDELYDDPYSEIIWPGKLRRFRQATEGNFIGVGILIRHNEKREIVVVNPLEGTPAYFAGVRPNDLIIQVDREPAVGWSLNDAVDRITGPKDETVTLGLQREGEDDLVQVPIVRDVIKLRTVKGWNKTGLNEAGDPIWDWFVDPVTRIAYVRLTQFTEDTYRDLRAAWDEITDEGRPRGLILDLRYNPGGLLTSAVDISNLWVQEGLIVSGEDKYGQPAFPDQRALARNTEMYGVPTVVLVNKGSASASEIVSGCLQAHGVAVVVGERSYGKGSVQTVHHITNKARMKLTTHYYRLPPADGEAKGRLVHKRPGSKTWGVDADILVKMTSNQVRDSIELRQAVDIIADGHGDADAEDRPEVTDLLTEGMDPQLQTALLILQARALGDIDQNARHARR